jgi:hypothetical protein
MPLDPVKCGCETHLKHTVYNAVIDGVDVCQLFHLLFSVDGMHFMAAFQQSRGTENYQPTAWPQDSESGGRKLRDFTYNIVFKAPMCK